MISKKSSVALFALTAAFQTAPAFAQYFELPNVVIDSPETKVARVSSGNDNLCWDFDSIRFRVRNRDLVVRSISVRYENGSVDSVSGVSGRRFANGPGLYGPFPVVKSGRSGQCVASITISGDDVDGDYTPGRGRARSYSLVDFEANGQLFARPERIVRPEPVPVPVPVPAPRPAPIYENRTRTSLDLNTQELIANPELIDSITRDYTVVFAQAEQAGAIRLKAAYDDAYIDEVVVAFANGTAERIELGSLITRDGWVVRDGVIYLAKGQSSGVLDLTGYGERNVSSITIRAREAQGGNEYTQSGLKPVIEVYGIGRKVESYQVCVANCY